MRCSRCGSPAEYFSGGGDPLCRTCYFAEQSAAQGARAAEEQRSADTASALMRARLVYRSGCAMVGAALLVVAGYSVVGFSPYLAGVIAFAAVVAGLGFWGIYRMYR